MILAETDLGKNIGLDTHVNGNEGWALLVSFPEQLLRARQCLLLHQVLKGVPACGVGDHCLHDTHAQVYVTQMHTHCNLDKKRLGLRHDVQD